MSDQSSTDHLVAVVTGGGRGIGRALVEVLSARGDLVIAVVRSQEHVDAMAEQLPKVLTLKCDITDPPGQRPTEKLLSEFLTQHVERVDLLVNNAGFGATTYGVSNLLFAELEDVLAVHCFGAIRCTRACLPFFQASPRAAIFNISSRFGSTTWVADGLVPNRDASYAYRIAKASLNMLTACLSQELSINGIRVLAIDPGKVKTRFGPADADTQPEDAAKCIVQLYGGCTETGAFVNAFGQRIPW